LKSLTTYYHGMRLGLPNIVLCKWEAILRKRSAAEDISICATLPISPRAMAGFVAQASPFFVALLSRFAPHRGSQIHKNEARSAKRLAGAGLLHSHLPHF
jgi:hypothetical protein